jgi:23S rRNA (cytosine1962-C5)-methyltransferase
VPLSGRGLAPLLAQALRERAPLVERLRAERTDAYRLFHGSAEGAPGLTVDRYGDLVLAQSFHAPLDPADRDALEGVYAAALPGCAVVYNDRSEPGSRVRNALSGAEAEAAAAPRVATEMGVRYRIQARHAGQDPWLFLDLRAGRRRVMAEAPGRSVLNLFAYTCGVGVAAAVAGAREVLNVDFAASSLGVGAENARLNDVTAPSVRSDVFAAARQLAGIGQPAVVRGRRMPPFPTMAPRRFDLVFLDPPRYAKGPFGVVDLVRDYASVFKPALLATAEGGAMVCCNNVAQVERDPWLEGLRRSAAKAGRAVRDAEWITPEPDFPSTDGRHPLKMVLLRV